MEHTERLFVYGTLRRPSVQKTVFGRTTRGVPDMLRRYRRSILTIKSIPYPVAVRSRSGRIQGSVLEVAKRELKKIDRYETRAYKRKRLVLESGVLAWVFVRA
ncbi:gamma-glutamylcyclotransferase [Candidatus Parcubacteria bacterium]|nr:MAG: gamma-glutamylcyclotransferase [Candidatus Parcubacteria bacterium]